MFQGITNQITDAQIEIHRQEVLRRYAELLEQNQKLEFRKQKKAATVFKKISLPGQDVEYLKQLPGLKSFFFGVFEHQENEKDKKRSEFIEKYLILKKYPLISDFFGAEYERIIPDIKPAREFGNLQRLVKRIKAATIDKYYYQEVSTMIQFLEKSAKLQGRKQELDRAIEMGKMACEDLKQVVNNLKMEDNWGSWELFFSVKTDAESIPFSGIDFAYKYLPLADAKSRAFSMLASPFFDNRDMKLHAKNLEGFLEAFIHNMIYDWLFESRVRTTLSKGNQLLSSVNMIIYGLERLRDQNNSELSLMEIERDKRISRTEDYVRQKLDEKF